MSVAKMLPINFCDIWQFDETLIISEYFETTVEAYLQKSSITLFDLFHDKALIPQDIS
jgi:hypothetical protein